MPAEKPWRTKDWWVSQANFIPPVKKVIRPPKKVIIHDATLNDGGQQPGVVFKKEDNIAIFRKLAEVGVQRISVGMPAISSENRETARAIAAEGLGPEIYSFSRCLKKDVDLALECDLDGLVMEIPGTEHLIRNAFGWTPDQAIEKAVGASKYAGEHGLRVSFMIIDFTRADLEYSLALLNSLSTKGCVDSVVVADSFAVANPQAISYLVKTVKEKINKPVEVHVHNEFGLATANALAAVCSGAEVVHTTVNGMGVRSGLSSLEEVVLSLLMLYGVDTGLKYQKLTALSRLVQKLSGVRMPSCKPVVGKNVFRIESGMIVEWWQHLRGSGLQLGMFPFRWGFVGQPSPRIILGKNSGKATVLMIAKDMGIEIPDDVVAEILVDIKKISEQKKKSVSRQEFKRILKAHGYEIPTN